MQKELIDYRLSEILEIQDNNFRKTAINFYKERLLELNSDPFSRRIIAKHDDLSIRSLEEILERSYLESSSFYHFPGQLVKFYPSIRELKSEKDYICCFSGGRIKEGSFYYYYRPLLEIVNSGKTYVLQKTIKLETGYLSFLPQTMNDFDIFTQKVEHYYNYPNEELDYEQINYYCGGSINLLQLKKKGNK